MDLGLVKLDGSMYLRWQGMSLTPIANPITTPLPSNWTGMPLRMEIKAFNLTHLSFSAGPASAMSKMQTIAYGAGSLVSYGFTGTILGVYATSNGGEATDYAYVSKWTYQGQGQFLD